MATKTNLTETQQKNDWFKASIDKNSGIVIDVDFNKTWNKTFYINANDPSHYDVRKFKRCSPIQVPLMEFELSFDINKCSVKKINFECIEKYRPWVLSYINLAATQEQIDRTVNCYDGGMIEVLKELSKKELETEHYSLVNDKKNELCCYIRDELSYMCLHIATIDRQAYGKKVFDNYYYPYSLVSLNEKLPPYITINHYNASDVIRAISLNALNNIRCLYPVSAQFFPLDKLTSFCGQ